MHLNDIYQHLHKIFKLKQVIRCLLIVPFPESSLNDEAGRQFMDSYEDYAKRARLMTSVHAMPKVASSAGGEVMEVSTFIKYQCLKEREVSLYCLQEW